MDVTNERTFARHFVLIYTLSLLRRRHAVRVHREDNANYKLSFLVLANVAANASVPA